MMGKFFVLEAYTIDLGMSQAGFGCEVMGELASDDTMIHFH